MILLKILIIFFLLIIFNKIYFILKKKIIFLDYFKKFIFYTILNTIALYSLIEHYKINILLNNKNSIIISFLIIIYFLFFFSLFLTVSLKSINSPTYDILNIIINNKTTKRDIIVKMKKKKIIKKRIKDLINQGIIKKQGGLKLTPFGIIVVKFFIIVKKNFKLRVEG